MSFGLLDFKYLNIEKNFTCPYFHTCTLMDSLAMCGETLSSGVKGICQAVSTQFVEFGNNPKYGWQMWERPNLRDFLDPSLPTGRVFSGPDKAMAVVYHGPLDRIQAFVSGYFNWLSNLFTPEGIGQLQHEIFPKNFTCPDFYRCKLVGSLASCEEKIRAGTKDICQVVSTNFAEFVGKSFTLKSGKLGWHTTVRFVPTGKIFSGPDMAAALVHLETAEKLHNFAVENSIWLAAIAGLGTAALAYGIYRLVKKM